MNTDSTLTAQLPPHSDWEALYVLTAKSLQRFVLAGGKLREMTGATLLIDEMARKFLETLLDSAGLQKDKDWWPVTQASGVARLLVSSEAAAQQLARIIPAALAEFAPGLECVQAVVPLAGKTYSSAAAEAERILIAERNFPPADIPSAPPMTTLNPRTGLPAVAVEHGSRLDLSAWRKRQRRNVHRGRIQAGDFSDITSAGTYKAFGFSTRLDVARHFDHLAGEEEPPDGDGPDALQAAGDPGFEALTGGERRFMAVVHADGNGMGEMFIRLGEELASPAHASQSVQQVVGLYATLSQAIERTTMQALEDSSGKLLNAWNVKRKAEQNAGRPVPPLPVWPVVAAGDDLTALFRADVVFEFLEDYITSFADESGKALEAVKAAFPWAASSLKADLFTAGAGAVLCKTHYPFRTAYALCESLASHAKKTAKATCSGAGSVTFHRLIHSAHVDEWEALAQGPLKGAGEVALSQAPYLVGTDNTGTVPSGPLLGDLRELARAADALPSGVVRQLLTYLRTDLTAAQRHWNRMREVARQSAKPKWEAFCAALCRLTGKAGEEFDILTDQQNRTPLPDALAMLESENSSPSASLNLLKPMKTLLLEIELLGPWHCGSGEPGERDLDAMTSRDHTELPWLPGKTLKGLLREASLLAEDYGQLSAGWTDWAWGGRSGVDDPDVAAGALDVRAARLPQPWRDWWERLEAGPKDQARGAFFYDMASTALDTEGVAKDKTLRRIECAVPVTLYGQLALKPQAADSPWAATLQKDLALVCQLVRRLGSHRTRGWGRCRVTLLNQNSVAA